MKLLRRILRSKILFATIVFFSVVAFWWTYSVYRFSKPWRRVAREDTEAQVLKLLGKPNYVFEWHEDPMKATYENENGEFSTAGRSVVRVFHYQSFLLGPYVVEFDSSGRVVAKGHNTLCCSQ